MCNSVVQTDQMRLAIPQARHDRGDDGSYRDAALWTDCVMVEAAAVPEVPGPKRQPWRIAGYFAWGCFRDFGWKP
jgi:hypothetical protein